MSEISSIALGGIKKATQSINESAEKISSGQDLGNAESIVELKQAQTAFEANVKVIKIDKKLEDALLDILA